MIIRACLSKFSICSQAKIGESAKRQLNIGMYKHTAFCTYGGWLRYWTYGGNTRLLIWRHVKNAVASPSDKKSRLFHIRHVTRIYPVCENSKKRTCRIAFLRMDFIFSISIFPFIFQLFWWGGPFEKQILVRKKLSYALHLGLNTTVKSLVVLVFEMLSTQSTFSCTFFWVTFSILETGKLWLLSGAMKTTHFDVTN